VWFGDALHPRQEVADELGALLEWSSADLPAVDAADGEHAQLIAGHLAEREGAGRLMFETGRS
jgi:hypothetical protein